MFKDDDDDEENTFNVTRYACMPSLVALQQMRNRLHLAHLGRKLMKWTALATGRELRKIAMELDAVVAGFAEEMRDAFILLARARYFCPELNSIVLENIGHNAAVMVIPTMKTVSAVKTVQFDILETGVPPYEHLGIQKGGQAIMEAKLVWLDLLKKLILMMQLRSSFIMVEQANKTATKKMNVLTKIVIPKTNVTSTYIKSEMEEYEREEFFRLKKILEIKRKMYEAHKEKKDKIMCTTCEPADEWDVIKRCIMCDALILPEEENTEEKEKLEQYKTHLDEIVNITKDMEEQGLITASIEEFIKTAEGLKEKLEPQSESESVVEKEEEPYDPQLDELCEECKIKYLEEKAAAKAEPEPEPAPLLPPPPEPKPIPAPPPPVTPEVVDLELGTFETEIQEITKIIRVKKEDGSVTEEKKVTRVRREVRAPVRVKNIPPPNPVGQERAGRITYQPSGTSGASGTSSKSNPYSGGSRTIGVVTTKSLDYNQFCPKYDAVHRRVRSELFNPPSPMSDPVARYCMSSVTLLSVDFGEYSSLEESFTDYDEFEYNKT